MYHIFSHWRKWEHSYSGYIISENKSAEYWDWHIKLVATSLQASFLGPLQMSCSIVYLIMYVCLAFVIVCERSGSLIKLWRNIPNVLWHCMKFMWKYCIVYNLWLKDVPPHPLPISPHPVSNLLDVACRCMEHFLEPANVSCTSKSAI